MEENENMYCKYESEYPIGMVASTKSNVILTSTTKSWNQRRYYAICAGLADLFIWDLKSQQMNICKSVDKYEITSLEYSIERNLIISGYANGIIRAWNSECYKSAPEFVLSGHKKSITCMCLDQKGFILISGSTDNYAVIWNLLEERAIARLRGHTAPITACRIMKTFNVSITCSRDCTIKLWDLDVFCCFATLTGHKSEILDITLLFDEKLLVAASLESDLKIWKISPFEQSNPLFVEKDSVSLNIPLKCEFLRSLPRSNSENVMKFSNRHFQNFFFTHTKQFIEVYCRLKDKNNEDGDHLMMTQSKKKKKNRDLRLSNDDGENDSLQFIGNVKLDHKICQVDVCTESTYIYQILVLYHNNTMELIKCSIVVDENKFDIKTQTISLLNNIGHKSDARALCFNYDGSYVASASAESIKLWDSTNYNCVNSFTAENMFCTVVKFVPGDHYILAACKDGSILIFELASAQMMERIHAHSKPIWAMNISHDKMGVLSGSADGTVKVWEFTYILLDETGPLHRSRKLSLNLQKSLKLDEEVLALTQSSNGKFIAVALLDSTVKIFFADTFKFYLSLYGHKLPVMTLDITTDCVLIATGSADKNVKIWGLDFGDCHKSIFSHDDSVTSLKFLPNKHLYFTASRDRRIRYWNADTYQLIMTLDGHFGEIWAIDVSYNGNILISSSKDKSLRAWKITDEPIPIEELKENEAEEDYEETLLNAIHPTINQNTEVEPGLCGVPTTDTLKYSESFIDALEDCQKEWKRQLHDGDNYELSSVFKTLNITPERFVLDILLRTRSCDIEESLMLLPYSHAADTLKLCDYWLKNGWEVLLCLRVIVFLLKLHFSQLKNDDNMTLRIYSLKRMLNDYLIDLKETVGINIAGMQHIQFLMEKEQVKFYHDALSKRKLLSYKKTPSNKKLKVT